MAKKFLGLVAVVLSACTPQPAVITAPIVVEPSSYAVASPKWLPAWTTHLAKSLSSEGASLLNSEPADIKEFCPGYKKGDKQFWIMLLTKLAQYESNYNPKAVYTEAFVGCGGVRVSSRGLFQISFCSMRDNYKCAAKNTDALYDPFTNITCAVQGAATLVPLKADAYYPKSPAKSEKRSGSYIAGNKNGNWQGMAAYWSPFRDAGKLAAIKAATLGLASCK